MCVYTSSPEPHPPRSLQAGREGDEIIVIYIYIYIYIYIHIHVCIHIHILSSASSQAGREGDEIIVVDLTGTGAQDAAIGQVAWEKLSKL